jgi:hypothetical protein
MNIATQPGLSYILNAKRFILLFFFVEPYLDDAQRGGLAGLGILTHLHLPASIEVEPFAGPRVGGEQEQHD